MPTSIFATCTAGFIVNINISVLNRGSYQRMIPLEGKKIGEQVPPELFESEEQAQAPATQNVVHQKSKLTLDASTFRAKKNDKRSLYAGCAVIFLSLIVVFFQCGFFVQSMSTLGDLSLTLEKPLIALEMFSIGLLFSPDDSNLCSRRANIEILLGKHADAVEDLTHLISLNGSRNALVQRASCYIRLRRPDEAMADLNEVLKNDQNNVDALILRGELNSHLCNYNSALTDLNHASKLNPNNVEAQNAWQQTFDQQYQETMEKTAGSTSKQAMKGKVAVVSPVKVGSLVALTTSNSNSQHEGVDTSGKLRTSATARQSQASHEQLSPNRPVVGKDVQSIDRLAQPVRSLEAVKPLKSQTLQTAPASSTTALSKSDRNALEKEAESAYRGGDFKAAISFYYKVIDSYRAKDERPAYVYYAWHIAKCYLKLGETSKAVECYAGIEPIYTQMVLDKVSKFPNLRSVIQDYAQALRTLGRATEAEILEHKWNKILSKA